MILLGLKSFLIFTLLWEAHSRTSPGIFGGPNQSWWLVPNQLRPVYLWWSYHYFWFMFSILSLLNWTTGIFLKYLQVDWAVTAESYELNWQLPNNTDGICFKEEFINRFTSRFLRIFLIYPSKQVKNNSLRTIIKSRVENNFSLQISTLYDIMTTSVLINPGHNLPALCSS